MKYSTYFVVFFIVAQLFKSIFSNKYPLCVSHYIENAREYNFFFIVCALKKLRTHTHEKNRDNYPSLDYAVTENEVHQRLVEMLHLH